MFVYYFLLPFFTDSADIFFFAGFFLFDRFQRQLYHFHHIIDKVKRNALSHIDRDIFNVLAVPRGQQNGFDAGPVSRKHFFLDAAHWQHSAAEA